jgi:chromosomal replication initiator protein
VTQSVFYIECPGAEGFGRATAPQAGAAAPNLRQYVGDDDNRLVQFAVNAFLDASPGCSPLVFCGSTGTGKSLLAGGLAARWKRHAPATRVVLTTGADFARQFATALETNALDDFRRTYRDAAVLIIDDLHQLGGKTAAQQELIHTFDSLLRHQRRLVATLQQSPAETPTLATALASRLCGGLVVPLLTPGRAARRVIVERLLNKLGIKLPEPVLRLLANDRPDSPTQPATVPQLHGAVLQLANLAAKEDRPLDEHLARHCLAARNTLCPQLRTIIRQVCQYFQLRAADLKGPTRQQRVVRARGVAMLLARQLTDKSLAQVGRHFGNRDHTTVMHACRKTESLLRSDPAIRQAVDELAAQLSVPSLS